MSSTILSNKDAAEWELFELSSFDGARPRSATNKGETVNLPTAAEIDRVYQQAHDEGFQAGRSEGYQQGMAQALQEAQQLAALGGSAQEALEAFDQVLAEDTLRLALDLAKHMLCQALKVKPELLIPIVREAMLALPGYGQHAVLLVNPADAALVRTHLGEELPHSNWRLVEDPKIERGGCRIEAAGCQIDATESTRWRRLLEGIGGDMAWLEGDQ